MGELVPKVGYDGLRDCPAPLFENIRLALMFLSWEELSEHEQPPKRLWLNGPELQAWFARVKKDREREAKGEGRLDPDDAVENAAARDLIVG